jgi:probable rRNA maturation factor
LDDDPYPPGLRIHLTDESCLSSVELQIDRIQRVAVALGNLVKFSAEGLSVGLHICGASEMAELHGQFMDDPTPTDVMAFEADASVEGYLGDVVVCWDVAQEEAVHFSHSAMEECWFYIVHGILHLMGFDDHTPEERQEMHELQSKALLSEGIEVSAHD